MAHEQGPGNGDIDLLHALKTAFSRDGDTKKFLARAAEEIQKVEATIIETCAKNRIRIDDNLYALLESRDAIGEQVNNLEQCTATASETTTSVNSALRELSNKETMRCNLDAALAVAARTRKLTRMYARIEDIIDSRRLYAAFRMLRLLEEETRAVQPDSVLRELVPDTRRLRSRIATQARRSLATWLAAVRAFERIVGEYALRHAAAQAASHQTLLDAPRGALGEPFTLLPLLPPAPPRGRGAARPWRPMLTPTCIPSRARHRRRNTAMLSPLVGLPKVPFGHDASTRPNIGRNDALRSQLVINNHSEDVPSLYLRPLLQAVHVSDGLNLLAEMQAEYRSRRFAHLQHILDEQDDAVDTSYSNYIRGEGHGRVSSNVRNNFDAAVSPLDHVEDELDVETDDADDDDDDDQDATIGVNAMLEGSTAGVSNTRSLSRVQGIETLVCKVTGFFVVERTVELHSSHVMISREVVDGEWWSLAYAKLLAVFKEYEENGLETAADKARVRNIEEGLERFAEINGLLK